MNIKQLIVIAGILLPFITLGQDPKEITKKAYDITDIDAMEIVSTIKIYDAKGNERVRQTATATKRFGETNKVITQFTAPADVKGTGILIYDYDNRDDDMWIYLPALRKTRRIVSSEKGKSYMGSEFSNADMSTPNLEDFKYKVLGSEKYNGIDCWQIEAVPVSEEVADDNGYSKRISLIDKKTDFMYKTIFYNFDGDKFKELTVGPYEPFGNGKYIIRKMEAVNLENGRRSEMTIDKIQKGSSLTESSFSPSALEK